MNLFQKFGTGVQVVFRSAIDLLAIATTRRGGRGGVLITRLDGIGDFVVWLDSARLLREHYADRPVTLVANQVFGDLARATGYFDQVIDVDVGRLEHDAAYRFGSLRTIRSAGADLALAFNMSRSFWLGDSVVRASGAARRVGFRGDLAIMRPWQRAISDKWYTQLIPGAEDLPDEFARNVALLKALGITDAAPRVADLKPVGTLPNGFKPAAPYMVIVPGAGSAKRIWPAERFGAVARSVAQSGETQIVLCGGPEEVELAESVAAAAGIDVINLAGRLSLCEFVEVVRGAQLLLGNETSSVHIAAAVGTPSVCILGGGHFGRFVPYATTTDGLKPEAVYHQMPCFNCGWVCTQPYQRGGPVPCIASVAGDEVLAVVKHLLRGHQPKGAHHA